MVFHSHQFQFVWSQVKFSRPKSLVESDVKILDRYEGSTRFGVSTEGGAKIELFKSLSASVSYEAEVVYPRFLGLKWVGSVLVQTIGIGGISVFAEDIVNSSPVFGPIMYMLLRNGAGYGFYYLMKYNSYWPIKSEKPLTNETSKIGASITF